MTMISTLLKTAVFQSSCLIPHSEFALCTLGCDALSDHWTCSQLSISNNNIVPLLIAISIPLGFTQFECKESMDLEKSITIILTETNVLTPI